MHLSWSNPYLYIFAYLFCLCPTGPSLAFPMGLAHSSSQPSTKPKWANLAKRQSLYTTIIQIIQMMCSEKDEREANIQMEDENTSIRDWYTVMYTQDIQKRSKKMIWYTDSIYNENGLKVHKIKSPKCGQIQNGPKSPSFQLFSLFLLWFIWIICINTNSISLI